MDENDKKLIGIAFMLILFMLALLGHEVYGTTINNGAVSASYVTESADSTGVISDSMLFFDEIIERGSIWDLQPKFYLSCKRSDDVNDSLATDHGVSNIAGTKTDVTYTTFQEDADAYWCNGSTNFVNLGSLPDVMKTGNFTWSFWLNPNPGMGDGYLVSMNSSHYKLYVDSSDNVELGYRNASNVGENARADDILTYDTWQHLVVTNSVNGTDVTTKWYIDGVLVHTRNDADGWLSNYGSSFYLTNHNPELPYSGAISKISFFDRALSANEAKTLYAIESRDKTVKLYSSGTLDVTSTFEMSHPLPATWWVSTTGSDVIGDGSYSSPYASIGKAVSGASGGDYVMVMPGIYSYYEVFLKSGVPHAPIIIEGIGNVTIDPATEITSLTSTGGYAWCTTTADIGFVPSAISIDNKIVGLAYKYLDDSIRYRVLECDKDSLKTYTARDGVTPYTSNWWNGVRMLAAVDNNTYAESLYVRDRYGRNPLTLGTLKATAQDSAAININNKSWITIRNITVRNAKKAVHIKGASHHIVVDNINVTSGNYGVQIEDQAYSNTIKNCTITFGYHGADTFGVWENVTNKECFIHANTYNVYKFLFGGNATDNVGIDFDGEGSHNKAIGNTVHDGLQAININDCNSEACYNTVYNMSSLGICTGNRYPYTVNLGVRLIHDNLAYNCNTNYRPHRINECADGRVDIYYRNRSWQPYDHGHNFFLHCQGMDDTLSVFTEVNTNIFATYKASKPPYIWNDHAMATNVIDPADLDADNEWYYSAEGDSIYWYSSTADTLGVAYGYDDGTRADIWIAQNSISGGYASVYYSSGIDDVDLLSYKIYIINNILSSPFPVYRPSSATYDSAYTVDVLDYNWYEGEAPVSWDDGHNVNAGSGVEFWPYSTTIDSLPDWTVPADSSAYQSGIDLSKMQIWDSTNYPKLPAFSAGQYFSGSAPNMGAIP